MGGGNSRLIPWDEVQRRFSDAEKAHYAAAFEAFTPTTKGKYMDKLTFTREVLGDNCPDMLGNPLFEAFDSESRGSLSYKDFLTAIAVLTKGRDTERAQAMILVWDPEKRGSIFRAEIESMLMETDGDKRAAEACDSLYGPVKELRCEEIVTWLLANPTACTITQWISQGQTSLHTVPNGRIDDGQLSLSDTLASVTGFAPREIKEMERRYWDLHQHSPSGAVDAKVLSRLLRPKVAKVLSDKLFAMFDENKDGVLDMRELVCGLAAVIHCPEAKRAAFTLSLFDGDGDGTLTGPESEELFLALTSEGEAFTPAPSGETPQGAAAAAAFPDGSANMVGWGRPKTLGELDEWLSSRPQALAYFDIITKTASLNLGVLPTTWRHEKFYIEERWREAFERGWKAGDKYFVVTAKWWASWKAYVGFDEGHAESPGVVLSLLAPEGADTAPGQVPPTIDNSDLLEKKNAWRGRLRPGLRSGIDFTVLPASVHSALANWYGCSPNLPRSVIAVGDATTLELYPLTLFVLKKFPTKENKAKPSLNPATAFSFSKAHTVQALIEHLCQMRSQRTGGGNNDSDAPPPLDPKTVRLWNCADWLKPILVSVPTNTLEAVGIVEGAYVYLEQQTETGEWPEEAKAVVQEEERAVPVHVEPGLTGLNNLGNTCFLNSAVQCLSNTEPLTDYMTKGMYRSEINVTNPLGYKGQIAKHYGELICNMWAGSAPVVAPHDFRYKIGKLRTDYATSQQQDSQEFLNFLLDGLHEDLNRIKTKPAVENKDSDGRPDKEVADEYWGNYLLRNQSIVVDLMTGQLKSTLICLHCSFESVKFEEFRTLSLPLPVDPNVYVSVIVQRRAPGSLPMRYEIKFPDNTGKVSDFRSELAKVTGIPPGNLVFVNVSAAYIHSHLQDTASINSIRYSTVAFEILPLFRLATEKANPAVSDIIEAAGAGGGEGEGEGGEGGGGGGGGEKEKGGPAAQSPSEPASTEKKEEDSQLPSSATQGEGRQGEEEGGNTSVIDTSVDGSGGGNVSVGEVHFDSTQASPAKAPTSANDSATAEGAADETASLSQDKGKGGVVGGPPPTTAEGGAGAGAGAGEGAGAGAGASTSTGTGTGAAAKPAEAAVVRTNNIFVAVCHRKVLKVDTYIIHPYKTRLFGVPFLLSFDPSGRTTKDLYDDVWNNVKRLLTVEDVATLNEFRRKQVGPNEEISVYPFMLRKTNITGTCSPDSSWNHFSIGTEIEYSETASIGLSHGDVIAIDWEISVYTVYYSWKAERAVEEHASVKENEELASAPVTLDACLGWFMKGEKLDKDDSWYCPKCKEFREASKKMDIWRMPPVLIIHLKRFHQARGAWIKSQRLVMAPIANMDISAHVVNPDAPKKLYDLYAVTNHYGSLGGGHYTAVALNRNDNKWYHFNDSSVSPMDAEERIVTPAAYVLFYKMSDTASMDLLPVIEGDRPVVEVPEDEDEKGDRCTIL